MTDAVPFLESAALKTLPGVRHAFFTRQGGASGGIYASLNGGLGSNDDPAAVIENRRRMTEALGVAPGALAIPWQVHSAEAVAATAAWTREAAPHVDAAVTQVRGLAVAVTVADCGPVLLADAKAGVVAAAHAGWKGALTGVLETTISQMETLGANRGDIVAALGPCIRQQSYEVGPEFAGRFTAADAENARFFAAADKPGHSWFDLGGYVVSRLEAAKIGAIDDLGVDTYADEERFFSFRRTTHRAEPDYGRLIAAIVLA